MASYGIDVSGYQGKIDWKRVKQAGCKFAVLKCLRKDLDPDKQFAANVKGCRSNGIPSDAYVYVYERTVSGAEKRAKAAVEICKKHGLSGCTIWWDVEDKSIRKSGVDNRAKLTASIKAARAVVSSAGFGFGVYCDADFYTTCINANDLKGRYWIAAYHGNPVTAFGKAPAYKKPTIANTLWGWQYCSKGRVPGISGSVDLDIVYGESALPKTNYCAKVARSAEQVYPLCVGKVHRGANVDKVVDLASLKKYKALSCNRMVSIVLQEAGLLPKGVVLGHTPKKAGKKSIADAVKNAGKLKHCKVVWVNKKFADLPAEYKKAGVVYIQNSNACISAGGGKIWSCNKSKGYRYTGKGDYLRDSGYPFTSNILVVIVPVQK